MKKISAKIKIEKKNDRILSLLNTFDNISIFPSDQNFEIELFLEDSKIKSSLLDKVKKEFNDFECSEIKKRNWVIQNRKDDKGIRSELFFISQGLSNKKKENKKYKLVIPGNNAFGTGCHASTYLSIKGIEYLTKKIKFFKICDLGTGSGILSFVLYKITKQNIISVDIDPITKECFLDNTKNNFLKRNFFLINDGLKCNYLRNKKFDLIVSNMLCNAQKKIVKDSYKRLKVNGRIIISGIIVEQENEIVSYFNKFNLNLEKKFYSSNWVALIFVKSG